MVAKIVAVSLTCLINVLSLTILTGLTNLLSVKSLVTLVSSPNVIICIINRQK